jgi:hypothetical protein
LNSNGNLTMNSSTRNQKIWNKNSSSLTNQSHLPHSPSNSAFIANWFLP